MHKTFVTSVGASLLGFVSLSFPVAAQDIEISAQANAFAERDPDLRGSAAVTLAFNPYARESDGSTHNLDVELFGRYAEGADAARKHADVRQLSYIRAWDAYELQFGVGRMFWGVTESAHIVDIVNQSDLLEDLDGEDKLGQPLFAVSRTIFDGRLQAIVMPHFRTRTFGPVYSELAPFPIAEDEARFEAEKGKQNVDYAFRLSQRFGNLDVGMSGFFGNAREPRLQPCAGQGSGRPGTQSAANCDLEQAFAPPEENLVTGLLVDTAALLGLGPSRDELEQQYIDEAMADVVFVPFYDEIRQLGLDAQWIMGAAAWKLEARYREQQGEWQLAAAAGVEYSLGTYLNDLIDAGILVEFLYDDRDVTQYLSLFEEDVFIGMRLLGNDTAGSQLLGGVVIDIDNQDQFWSVEASRRFGSNLRAALEFRAYEPGEDEAVTDFLDDIDALRIELTYYL